MSCEQTLKEFPFSQFKHNLWITKLWIALGAYETHDKLDSFPFSDDDDHSIIISVRLVWKIYFVVVIIRNMCNTHSDDSHDNVVIVVAQCE